MRIDRATPDDAHAVEALLRHANLPLEGATEALALGVVARDGTDVVAAAARRPLDVVHRDRGKSRIPGLSVDQHRGHPPRAKTFKASGCIACRRDEHAEGALLLEVHEFDPAKRRSPELLRLLGDRGFTYAVTHVTPLPWRQPRAASWRAATSSPASPRRRGA